MHALKICLLPPQVGVLDHQPVSFARQSSQDVLASTKQFHQTDVITARSFKPNALALLHMGVFRMRQTVASREHELVY